MSEDPKITRKQKKVDPEKAAMLLRLKVELTALASAQAGGIAAVCYLDPSERLIRSLRSVEHASRALDLSFANKVHALVLRVMTKPTSMKAVILKLDRNAVESSSRVLTETTRALASLLGSHGRKPPVQVERFVKRCTSTMCQFCEMCESPAAWKYALEYIYDGAASAGVPFDEFLSEENLGQSYPQIEAGGIAALNWFLQAGQTVALTELAGLFRRHEGLKSKATSRLTELFSERASMLPSVTQRWIMSQLGLAPAESDFEYGDPSDSPAIRQAATLLLFLFDQRTRGVELEEAFARFRGLCEAHFHLILRGEVGKTTEFDSRLHEMPESSSGELRLMRPWVEWYLPPNARIVIRGIVESKAREKEVM